MTDEKPIWRQAFPYSGGNILVTHSAGVWRVSLGVQEAEATTLVEAFEILLGRRAGDEELKVVLAALSWGRGLGTKQTQTVLRDVSAVAIQPVEADEGVA